MLRFLKKKSDNFSDLDLLDHYRSSEDLEVLGKLYDRYIELVYGVCLKYLKDASQAEDAVMDIFEELVEKVKQHEILSFKSWLYVLSKNHCLMQLRKNNRNLTVSYEPEVMQSIDQRHHNIELEEENTDNGLKNCIEQLSSQQKQCIQLFYFEGKSYKEIADQCKEEIGKVRSHIQNGRRNLKICMEKHKEEKRVEGKG